MNTIYLSKRNLLTLLSKLERAERGDVTACTIIKRDTAHPKYPQSVGPIAVIAVADDDYYAERAPGYVHPEDIK